MVAKALIQRVGSLTPGFLQLHAPGLLFETEPVLINMSDKPVRSLVVHRNNDGTSVLDTREGIRLIKAGFTSHAEAKQWCEDWHPQHGTIRGAGVKH